MACWHWFWYSRHAAAALPPSPHPARRSPPWSRPMPCPAAALPCCRRCSPQRGATAWPWQPVGRVAPTRWPLLLCALSSALAFFAFFPTAYRGLSELGLIAGAGMFIAFFLNFTLLPALLSLTVPPPRPAHAGPVARAGVALQHGAGRRARGLATLGLLLALAAALALPYARFDDDPLNLRDADSPSVAALLDLMTDPRVAPYSAQLLVDELDAARQVAPRLQALPEVQAVVTITEDRRAHV